LLAFEGGEFGACFFGVVFVCNHAVREPLELGVALADVLVEACNVVVGCFELLSEQLGVRLVFFDGVSEVVSVLTRFG
jgi:hypothetical protein